LLNLIGEVQVLCTPDKISHKISDQDFRVITGKISMGKVVHAKGFWVGIEEKRNLAVKIKKKPPN